ncbi:AAA family ATPase [Desulfocurvibacter africanus]|uniref:NadR/Ttd14 AAA domain-containing protein n=1 Tax=Desulfocurvibacter africanus subsp. africanus str. Walvis Bay TaxID=690850 RepID=F3Z3D6_DESAF|nr:AAA family ATPase [Desulfocurvibacter africanus]EGJ51476.1 hypothetical protein Desaf_3181 [Desulfocurvibacter africanus subsp. africanus str. Walvis Bay]
MKIAFTGTSSTGKTTTANHLKANGVLKKLGLELISPPNTRAGLTQQIDELSDFDRLRYQDQRFREKLLLEEPQTNFLVERSFVDLLAYRCSFSPSPSQSEIDMHIKLSKEYTLHFFFPFGVIPYEPDGKRPSDRYSHAISRMIQEILETHNIDYVPLKTPSIEERCDIIFKEISKFK